MIFMFTGIYEKLRQENGIAGSLYYVGKGRGPRKHRPHVGGAKVPKNPTRIVVIQKNLSEADAFQLEMNLIFLIGRLSSGTGCLRNLTEGGEGVTGLRWSRESKENQSRIARQRGPQSPETIQKRVLKNTGQKRTPEQRKFMSSQMKGVKRKSPKSPELRAKMSLLLKGKTRTEEAKVNISKGLSGKPKSEEHKRAMSKARRGRKRYFTTEGKMFYSKTPPPQLKAEDAAV